MKEKEKDRDKEVERESAEEGERIKITWREAETISKS